VPDSKTLQLLLVEDSLEDEQLLCDALLEIEENRQWCNWLSSSIVPVDRLSDALDCLRRGSFDAVLLNLSLPDSPALLHSFLEVHASAGCTPILVLADEPDENLANRLLRAGAQDVLVKAELECAPLARAVRYAIERQRLVNAARASAFVDDLTGVLTRDAFLTVAAHRSHREALALVDIAADRETLDPLLIQAAEALRRVFEAPAVLGRWDRRRFCVFAPKADLHRAAGQLSDGGLQFSITSLEEIPDGGELPLRAKIAMLAD
jgi:PleD family two-component response regulator